MNPSLDQALAILNPIDWKAIARELHEDQPGHPKAQAYDSDRTSSGQGPSDPTHVAATSPNAARHDRELYEAAIVRVYTAALTLAALEQRWAPRHEAPRVVADQPQKACALHVRAGVSEIQPRHVTTDFGKHLGKMVGDTFQSQPLPEPIPVCEACYDYTRRQMRLPTNDELRAHARTGKWKVRVGGTAA